MKTLLLTLLLLTPLQQPTISCTNCTVWNAPQPPLDIYGNTYYVGPHGISAILITSPSGHILIDGALAESAPQIADHITALGFKLKDIKIILNSHIHFDHAGGIAELQRLTGARVLASPWSAKVLSQTGLAPDDPQFGIIRPIPTVPGSRVKTLADNEVIRVGPLAVTAHFTPGHTPGGTSFTWQSCEASRCLNLVYADSVSTVSAPAYRFTDHPDVVSGLNRSFQFLDSTPCDLLLTPHPDALDPDLFLRLASHQQHQTPDTLLDPTACHRLADAARTQLQKRLATEAKP